jgi:hypothetical protein
MVYLLLFRAGPARATRKHKRRTGPDELMAGGHQEMHAIGVPHSSIPKYVGAERKDGRMVLRRRRTRSDENLPEIVRFARDAAARDPQAFSAAQRAVEIWLSDYAEVARLAGESDRGETTATRQLIEGFSAASASREALQAGDSTEAIFNEQVAIAQGQAGQGVTKEWVVGFMHIRCIAVGLMFGLLGHKEACIEFGRRFREFTAMATEQ